MIEVKLYRECDIGGAHSGGVNIPGLIAKEKDANTASGKKQLDNEPPNYHDILKSYVKDIEGYVQTKHKQDIKDLSDFANYALSSIGYTPTNSQERLMPDPQWLVNQQNQQNQQSVGNRFFDKNQVYGPPRHDSNKISNIRKSDSDYFRIMEMIKSHAKNPPLSQFEILIDSLFSPVEKLDFLKSLGYEHVGTDKVRSNKVDQDITPEVVDTVKDAFLREITKKFKSMLLAKGTIKIKF